MPPSLCTRPTLGREKDRAGSAVSRATWRRPTARTLTLYSPGAHAGPLILALPFSRRALAPLATATRRLLGVCAGGAGCGCWLRPAGEPWRLRAARGGSTARGPLLPHASHPPLSPSLLSTPPSQQPEPSLLSRDDLNDRRSGSARSTTAAGARTSTASSPTGSRASSQGPPCLLPSTAQVAASCMRRLRAAAPAALAQGHRAVFSWRRTTCSRGWGRDARASARAVWAARAPPNRPTGPSGRSRWVRVGSRCREGPQPGLDGLAVRKSMCMDMNSYASIRSAVGAATSCPRR